MIDVVTKSATDLVDRLEEIREKQNIPKNILVLESVSQPPLTVSGLMGK